MTHDDVCCSGCAEQVREIQAALDAATDLTAEQAEENARLLHEAQRLTAAYGEVQRLRKAEREGLLDVADKLVIAAAALRQAAGAAIV